jgi:hypothetical protein
MEAAITNETDRVWDFNKTKSTALRESLVQQMRYARWTFEIEGRERRVSEKTPRSENSDLPTNAKSLGRAQISNQLAAVNSQQTIGFDKKVVTVYNKRKTTGRRIAADEVN